MLPVVALACVSLLTKPVTVPLKAGSPAPTSRLAAVAV
jgi:hypothetical protein